MSDMFEKKIEKIIPVAAGIILRSTKEKGVDEVLLIRRAKDDHFPHQSEIPRGKCDQGDKNKLLDCLKREVKEETGLDIEPTEFVGKFSYIADEGKRKSTQYNYVCRMIDPTQEVKLSNEHDGYCWVKTVGEAQLHLMPEVAKIIADVLNPKMKIYDYPENENVEKTIDEYLSYIG